MSAPISEPAHEWPVDLATVGVPVLLERVEAFVHEQMVEAATQELLVAAAVRAGAPIGRICEAAAQSSRTVRDRVADPVDWLRYGRPVTEADPDELVTLIEQQRRGLLAAWHRTDRAVLDAVDGGASLAAVAQAGHQSPAKVRRALAQRAWRAQVAGLPSRAGLLVEGPVTRSRQP